MITAVGDTVAANRSALLAGQSGIGELALFPTRYASILPCAEIKTSTEKFREKLQANERGVTRTSLLALHAFEELLLDRELTHSQLASPATALIGSSTVGGMCLTDELYQDAQKSTGGSEYINSYDCSSVVLYLRERFKMMGITNTINTACSSSANAIQYGARLIRNGLARRAIVGGVDSLARFTINGFNALHILSPSPCTPFDEGRRGLNLGEGAAFLVLEKEEDIAGQKVYGELAGFCNSTDAFHPSSLSDNGEGPYLAMRGALELADLAIADIDFINAHGTGTENNDLVESRAMQRLFTKPPAFASTKANTGHTLGAAGAIEAAYSLLNLYYQELYPGLNFSNPIAETGLAPVRSYEKKPLQHVMSNSFGFGGNCTSLVFSKS
jgi:3-oxoacyl-(acyl-carrier-protein) synthase